jgi:DNA (cytosine-5)-methyltransferase 1
MKAVSLFAGVGGFDLALERNGVDVVASVEINKQARSILAKQFPKSNVLEDVKDVTGKQLFEYGFDSDGVIVGGFPCQDLSVAGKRKGLAGERSGLFWEIYRLLEETKAKWFILENVPGLLSSNGGRDLGIVIGALAELRYGVAYRILDSQYFGVPQRRRRIFIVGCLGDDGGTPAEILAIAQGRTGYIEASNTKQKNTFRTAAKSFRSSSNKTIDKPTIFEATRVNDSRFYTDYSPTVATYWGTGGARVPYVLRQKMPIRRLTPLECERLQGFPDNWTAGQADSHRYKQMGNAVTVPVVEWIIKRLLETQQIS